MKLAYLVERIVKAGLDALDWVHHARPSDGVVSSHWVDRIKMSATTFRACRRRRSFDEDYSRAARSLGAERNSNQRGGGIA